MHRVSGNILTYEQDGNFLLWITNEGSQGGNSNATNIDLPFNLQGQSRILAYELQSFENTIKMKTRLFNEVLLIESSSQGLGCARTRRFGKRTNKQLYARKHSSLRLTNKFRKPS